MRARNTCHPPGRHSVPGARKNEGENRDPEDSTLRRTSSRHLTELSFACGVSFQINLDVPGGAAGRHDIGTPIAVEVPHHEVLRVHPAVVDHLLRLERTVAIDEVNRETRLARRQPTARSSLPSPSKSAQPRACPSVNAVSIVVFAHSGAPGFSA